MKTKYIATLVMGGLMTVFTTGCEDRLDIAKHGNLGGVEDFYKTDADAEQAAASMYTSWRSQYYNMYYLLNMLSDEAWCGGGGRGDNAEMEKLNEYTFGSDLGMNESLYTGLYAMIYKANLIIDNVADDTETKKRDIAEAKFFRAWADFYLVTLWGPVPLVDHVLAPSEYRQGNASVADHWAAIEKDLAAAIAVLPSKTGLNDTESNNRVTKEAAEAYLGKAYLFQGKYAEAATTLDKVIDSNLYKLWDGAYDKLLHASANNCCENILEAQLRNDPEQAWNQFSMLHIMQGWRTAKMDVTAEAQSWLAMGTYGFMNPRKSLYDAFVAEEGVDGYRLNASIKTNDQLKAAGISLRAGESQVGSEGYWMWKNRCLKEDCVFDASYFQALQYINPRVMRFAEVLLMAAEAKVQSGSTDGKALKYVNLIRTRAKLQPLASVDLDAIKREKRLELCAEMVRYQDLVRWGDAASVMAEQGKTVYTLNIDKTGSATVDPQFTNTTYGFKAKHKLLPIPLKEIELNPNMKQNEGWVNSDVTE